MIHRLADVEAIAQLEAVERDAAWDRGEADRACTALTRTDLRVGGVVWVDADHDHPPGWGRVVSRDPHYPHPWEVMPFFRPAGSRWENHGPRSHYGLDIAFHVARDLTVLP